MKLPIGLFTALGTKGYKLYSYFTNGAKIAAALKINDSTQTPLGPSYKNPVGVAIQLGTEINVFNFRTRCTLRLKNISKFHAYNIRILNGANVFSSIDKLEELASLAPNEHLDIDCWFVSNQVHTTNAEKQNYDSVHPDKIGKTLVLSYDNEAGNTFYTLFKLTPPSYQTEYSLKNPLLQSK